MSKRQNSFRWVAVLLLTVGLAFYFLRNIPALWGVTGEKNVEVDGYFILENPQATSVELFSCDPFYFWPQYDIGVRAMWDTNPLAYQYCDEDKLYVIGVETYSGIYRVVAENGGYQTVYLHLPKQEDLRFTQLTEPGDVLVISLFASVYGYMWILGMFVLGVLFPKFAEKRAKEEKKKKQR